MRLILKSIVLFYCMALPVQAIEENPFMAQVAVESQESESRQKAIITALKQVLIKNSQHKNILKRPAIKKALRKSQDYMQQYYYATEPAMTAEGAPQKYIYVSFDPSAIKNLIEHDGQKVKPPIKITDIMTWFVVIEADQEPYLLGMDDQLLQQFQQSAAPFYLNLLLPLLDLEDQTNISSQAILNLNPRIILNASIRYQAPLNLAIKYQITPELFSIDATILDQYKKHWHYEDKDQATVFKKLNQSIRDYFSKQPSPKNETLNSGVYKIKIDNVKDINAYLRLQNYFSSAPQIAHFKIKEMTGTQVNIEAQLKKDLHDLFAQADFNHYFYIQEKGENNRETSLILKDEIIEDIPDSELVPVILDSNHE